MLERAEVLVFYLWVVHTSNTVLENLDRRVYFCPHAVISRVLPNFNTFIKVVLKKENLSEEAESYRTHYEKILTNMEEAPPLRPVSLIGDDDSGYHSTKPKGIKECALSADLKESTHPVYTYTSFMVTEGPVHSHVLVRHMAMHVHVLTCTQCLLHLLFHVCMLVVGVSAPSHPPVGLLSNWIP